MSGSKIRLIIVRTVLVLLALIGVAALVVVGTVGAYIWHRVHVANLERSWVNPIKDETFQVDLDLDAEGRSYHITRAYKCSDVDVFVKAGHGVKRNIFANQRIITQHLPSGNTVFIAVPNGCYSISRMRIDNRPCEESNDFDVGASRADIDCSGRWPVIRDHIPLVLWTGDAGKPKTLVAYVSSASFESHDSHVKKAVAVVTLQKGLVISLPDENEWLSAPLNDIQENTQIKYFGYIKFTDMSCWTGTFDWRFYSYRLGYPVPKQSTPCIVPFDTNGTAMEQFSGLMWLYARPKKITTPSEWARSNQISAVGMEIRKQKELSYDN